MKNILTAYSFALSVLVMSKPAIAERMDSVQVTVCKVSPDRSYCFMKIERQFDDPSTHSKIVCDKNEGDETYPCPSATECEQAALNLRIVGGELASYTGTDNQERCNEFKSTPLRVRNGGGR